MQQENSSHPDQHLDALELDEVQFQFDELVKMLILLSWPAEKQSAHFVVGCAGDEMAIDFSRCYLGNKEPFIKRQFLSVVQLEDLDQLYSFLHQRAGQEHEYFWFDLSDPEWEEVRYLAQNSLQLLDKDQLTLKVFKKIQYSTDPHGKKYVSEWTQVELEPL